MNHRERIHAALRREPVDHVPVALWRHFPNDDLRAEGLAARVVEFQRKYDFDFVKVTPASGYPAEMYGATFRDGQNREGTRAYVTRPVNTVDDWDKIVPLDEKNPVFDRETKALKLIRQELGPDVPILQTIFGPLNSAHNIAGERLFEDLRESPDRVHAALQSLADTTARFAIASLRAGADSIFFATQMATRKYLTETEFRKFAEPYDLSVIEGFRTRADFTLLHIHGLDIYFDLLDHWLVQAINWHDRRTPPSLKEARAGYDGALVGGVDEWNTLAAKSPDDVKAQAREAVAQTGGRGFVLSAGCVIPIDTPEENIRAAIDVVRGQ
jgi:uroporphyrinogen decarboxylase